MRLISVVVVVLLACSSCRNTTDSGPAGKITKEVISLLPSPLEWENKPSYYSIDESENEIVIEAGEKTDMFRDPNVTYHTDNAPKLLFQADNDFVLSCAIEHNFANKWDGGALVLKSDSLHWIKFCFEKDYTGAKRIVSVVTNFISDDCNSVELTSQKAFFKMAKADKVVTLYCSPDESNWLLIRHFQFETKLGFKAGFLAQSPTGKNCRVKFSSIHYRSERIKNPYLGE